jgi:hypothetical protein
VNYVDHLEAVIATREEEILSSKDEPAKLKAENAALKTQDLVLRDANGKGQDAVVSASVDRDSTLCGDDARIASAEPAGEDLVRLNVDGVYF